MDEQTIQYVLSEVLDEFIKSRKQINIPKIAGTFPADVLDEVLSSITDTRDIKTMEMTSERNYQDDIKEALIETSKYVTELTGFKCGTYTLSVKNYPKLKSILACYCPKLKLNLYFETLYKVPENRNFVYYDLAPDSMYGRMHNEYRSIHEAILAERNIKEHELTYDYFVKSSEEKKEFVRNLIKQLAIRKGYVGGPIDPRFPQREPEDESSDSDNEEQMLMNLVEMMMYHPDNPADFDYNPGDVF